MICSKISSSTLANDDHLKGQLLVPIGKDCRYSGMCIVTVTTFFPVSGGIRALAIMAGQHRKPNVDQPSSHQRDLRDIELDELRRQVQQLQQRLELGKAPEHEVYDNVSEHDISEDGDDVNPFHHFEGKHDVDEFIDWLNTIEIFFELKDVPDNQNVKIAAIKLKKHASIWWEHLKKQRVRDGKGKIVSWDKMKKALKKKFLPENYCQDVFLKFHSFK
ncbi:hypothetical protein ACH5RR_029854 [Cinchona calisaya]|uniref:Retrotransposon gag domain-containing protein n=1 Tax=Cinchona calisaya TaxID=153742 RepID=A0ABD2YY31_9GENT